MRNCRCFVFFFAYTASSSFHRPSTSHQASQSQSQSQSCRLAWLSARVESFSVNGQPPLPSPTNCPFECALPALWLSFFYLLLCLCCCYCYCRLLSTFLLFICLTRCAMPLFLRSLSNNTRVCYCYRCCCC